MRRCFVDIGLAEDREKYPDTGFNKYTSHRRGTLLHASSAFKKLEEAEDATSLGEEATGLLMLQRGSADSDDEAGPPPTTPTPTPTLTLTPTRRATTRRQWRWRKKLTAEGCVMSGAWGSLGLARG